MKTNSSLSSTKSFVILSRIDRLNVIAPDKRAQIARYVIKTAEYTRDTRGIGDGGGAALSMHPSPIITVNKPTIRHRISACCFDSRFRTDVCMSADECGRKSAKCGEAREETVNDGTSRANFRA